MEYDFTTMMDRRGRDALALDAIGSGGDMAPEPPEDGFDVIPMWVADMNFPVLPAIPVAIESRLREGHFGYFAPREEYFEKIIDWQRVRHGTTDLFLEHIGYENGVLGGVVSAVRAFASPGDKVLVHGPTYIGFTHSVGAAGYDLVLSPLKLDTQGIYRMDFDDMERKIVENKIHVAIFCSPHNPCGRVWQREEIAQAMEVYRRHDCVVISDEIWSDIIMPGHVHVPTQLVSDDARTRTIALYAPSKTFNLAGIVGAYHVIYNDYLRDRVESAAAKTSYNSMNLLSMYALLGAYGPEGHAWVDELCKVIQGNVSYALDFMAEHFEGVRASVPEGTYMLLLDFTQWCRTHGCGIQDVLRAGWRVGVAWQDARPFHAPCHIRMNLALPLSRVKEAFRRLAEHTPLGSS